MKMPMTLRDMKPSKTGRCDALQIDPTISYYSPSRLLSHRLALPNVPRRSYKLLFSDLRKKIKDELRSLNLYFDRAAVFGRPSGTRPHVVPKPAINRWATLICPSGTGPSGLGTKCLGKRPSKEPSRRVRYDRAQLIPELFRIVCAPFLKEGLILFLKDFLTLIIESVNRCALLESHLTDGTSRPSQ
jgi:hypothetical protein